MMSPSLLDSSFKNWLQGKAARWRASSSGTNFCPFQSQRHEFPFSLQSPMDLNGDMRLIQTFHEEESGNKFTINWAGFAPPPCMYCTIAARRGVLEPRAVRTTRTALLVNFDTEKCTAASTAVRSVRSTRRASVLAGDHKIDKCTACMGPAFEKQVSRPACGRPARPEALRFGNK